MGVSAIIFFTAAVIYFICWHVSDSCTEIACIWFHNILKITSGFIGGTSLNSSQYISGHLPHLLSQRRLVINLFVMFAKTAAVVFGCTVPWRRQSGSFWDLVVCSVHEAREREKKQTGRLHIFCKVETIRWFLCKYGDKSANFFL